MLAILAIIPYNKIMMTQRNGAPAMENAAAIAAFAAECAVEAIELEAFDPSAHTAEINMGLHQTYADRFGEPGDGWDLVFCPVFNTAVTEARRMGRI